MEIKEGNNLEQERLRILGRGQIFKFIIIFFMLLSTFILYYLDKFTKDLALILAIFVSLLSTIDAGNLKLPGKPRPGPSSTSSQDIP